MKTKEDFKLLAIRPLDGCDKRYVKVLKEDCPYVFYRKFDFTNYSGKGTIDIDKSHEVDIYSVTTQSGKIIKINVSAIVGENGTGKSTITELLYVSIYNIAVLQRILYDEIKKRSLTKKDIVPNIKSEIFYELNSEVYRIKLDGEKVERHRYIIDKGFVESRPINRRLLDFFYTIALNYSLHSLNSRSFGRWSISIFHKNDGYQTPIVLTPYREEGVIDINKEEYLTRARLLANILGDIEPGKSLEESLSNIVEAKIAYKLYVKIDKDKFDYYKRGPRKEKIKLIYTERYQKRLWPLITKYFLEKESTPPKNTQLNIIAKEYIIRKVINIAEKYEPYKTEFKTFPSRKLSINESYISRLAKNNSHVTFKLRQALNFLFNDIYFDKNDEFELPLVRLSNKLKEESRSKEKKLIDLLPPSFFDVDIEFQDKGRFSELSSGEKQKVYSVSNVIYHLININSVDGEKSLLKFKNVNIIFDEIELYFHPELQRTFIFSLLETLKRTNLYEINSINFLFVTHSPFILSDIPQSNILFLKSERSEKVKKHSSETFCANIYDILRDGFFLDYGHVGKVAQEFVNNILKCLDQDVLPQSDYDKILHKIKLIGEPVIRERLNEIYYEKVADTAIIRKEIDRLKSLLK